MRFEDQAEHNLALKIAAVVLATFVAIAAVTSAALYFWRENGGKAMLRDWMEMVENRNGPGKVFVDGSAEEITSFVSGRRIPPMFRNVIVVFSNGKTVTSGALSFFEAEELGLPNVWAGTFFKREFSGRGFLFFWRPFDDRTVWVYASSEGEAGDGVSNIVVGFLVAALAFVVGLYFVARYLAKESFDPMRESLRIMGLYNRQIAHELRTPLAVLKSDLELSAYSGEVPDTASSLEEVRNIEKIIDSLLFLAENPRIEHPERIWPDEIFRKKWEFLAKKYPDFSCVFEGKSMQTDGSPELVSILAGVLLENAAVHASEKRMAVSFSGNSIRISNPSRKDLPSEILHHVFEPFFKFESNGSGLGLSIAKKIADAHGWGLAFDIRDGQATVRITVGTKPKKRA